MTKFKDFKGVEIEIDIENITLRGASAWEQKYGYYPDVYFVYTKFGDILATIDRAYADAAFRVAVKNNTLDKYMMELDGKTFVYESGKWILDAVINPASENYSILYFDYDRDQPAVVKCATFTEARQLADENSGIVRFIGTGHELYVCYEPDSYIG